MSDEDEDVRFAIIMALRSRNNNSPDLLSQAGSDLDLEEGVIDEFSDSESISYALGPIDRVKQRLQHEQVLKAAALADTTWDKQAFNRWLKVNKPNNPNRERPMPLRAPADLNAKPLPQELHAGAWLHFKCASARKGALFVHPHLLGHNLSMLLAVCTYRKPKEDGTIVIVVAQGDETSIIEEIKRYYGEETYKVKMLREKEDYVSPTELNNYDMVVTSYIYLADEKDSHEAYLSDLKDFEDGEAATAPEAPRLCLLAGLMHNEAVHMGKYLLLHDAHELHNMLGSIYKACRDLRKCFDACIMATSWPHDEHDWLASYAFASMLEDHPLTAEHLMLVAFTNLSQEIDDEDWPEPEDKDYERYERFFAALTVP